MATCPSCRKRYPDDVLTCENDGDTLLPNEAFTGVDADLSAGQMVGEYRIEGKLGEGGFGTVYKALHPLIGKHAAVKVLNRQYSANPQMVSRFIAEARAVNQIRHRNIIDIFAFGALEDGRQYFIMELLEGLPLDKYLKERGRLGVEEALTILRPVARALDAAHATGIAHRDLKPENIFLSFDEDGLPFPKLLDFGIAKLLTPDATAGGASAKTRTGTPMGTPYYMSPEQCRGKNVDHRTDIYSFGIMVHQVLAGKLPFDGDDLMDLLIKQSTVPAPPLSSMAGDLPASLDASILGMLEKEPDRRPASLGAAIEAFIAAAHAAGFAVTPTGAATSGQRSALSTSGASPFAATASKATPSGAVAEAKTGAPRIQTFQGADLDVRPAVKRRSSALVLLPIALLMATVGAISAMVVLRRAPSLATHDSAKTAEMGAAALPPASAASAPSASVSSAVSASPLPDVLVTVRATPEHAVIWRGDAQLGVAPGPVKVARGDGKVKLTLKADGYAPSDVEIEPSENVVVSVKLAKTGGRAPTPQKRSGEYEDPFK